MRDWLDADGPLDVVDPMFRLFYKGKSNDTRCTVCDVRLKLGRRKTPKSLCESLEAHLKLHSNFAMEFEIKRQQLLQKGTKGFPASR